MNKPMISVLAIAAVSLLSGCQHVSVRHNYPAPTQVVERTVYVEHHDTEVYEYRHEHRPPPRVVVTTDHPERVIHHRSPAPVAAPLPRHREHHHDRYSSPRPAHSRQEHTEYHRAEPRVRVIESYRSPLPPGQERARQAKHLPEQRNENSEHQRREARPVVKVNHSRQQMQKSQNNPSHAAQQANWQPPSRTGKPEKHSNNGEKRNKQKKKKQHDERKYHRREI